MTHRHTSTAGKVPYRPRHDHRLEPSRGTALNRYLRPRTGYELVAAAAPGNVGALNDQIGEDASIRPALESTQLFRRLLSLF